MLTNLRTDPEWEERIWKDSPDEEALWGDQQQSRRERGNPHLLYLRDTARYPLLTSEDEAELATEIQECQENLVQLLMEIPIPVREIDQLRRRIRADGKGKGRFRKSNASLIQQILLRLREIDAVSVKNGRVRSLLDHIHQVESRLRKTSDRMVQSNLRLVLSLSKGYLNRGLPLLDLIQEGNMGLMKATARFDPSRGLRFSTYAVWWIRQAIHRAIEEKGRTIRMPVHMVGALNRYRRIVRSLAEESEESGDLPPEQMMKKARLSRGQWEVLQNPVEEPVSLETATRDEGARVIDLLPDRKTPLPLEVSMRKELSEKLRKTLKMLSPREEGLVKQRFGIDNGKDYTLEEIGRQLGVSRERVRQIEKQALAKLKKMECGKELKSLWELNE